MKNLRDYIFGASVALLVILAIYLAFTSVTKTVRIDEKHFRCTAAESYGIEARCTQYTHIGVK